MGVTDCGRGAKGVSYGDSDFYNSVAGSLWLVHWAEGAGWTVMSTDWLAFFYLTSFILVHHFTNGVF